MGTYNKTPIIIDVDLTVVDSGWPWMDWMATVYDMPPNQEMLDKDSANGGLINYNLSVYFPDRCKEAIPPYEFWEDPHLYDKLRPIPGVVEAVKALHEAGHPIRFVSYCKKGHFSSKVRFLKRLFPFLDLDGGSDGCGFWATKNKAGVKGGVIIDDRHQFLNQFEDDVIKIKFDTPFTQDEAPRVKYDLVSSSWGEIKDYLLETL